MHTLNFATNVVPKLLCDRSLLCPPPSPSTTYLSIFGRCIVLFLVTRNRWGVFEPKESRLSG